MTDPPRKKRPRPPTPEEVVVERQQSRRNGFIALVVLSVLMPTLFFINLMRDRHRQDQETGLVPMKTLPTESKRATNILDNDEDLTVTPAVAKPSRHDVAFSIGSVLADARACFKTGPQSVQATWQVNPDGSAADVTQNPIPAPADAADRAEEVFACIAATVKQAHVAPFDGAPVHVTYTFRSTPVSPGPR